MPNIALRRVSDIRPQLVLECSFEQKRFGTKEREKARVLQEEVILVGEHPHCWFLSDQASWVKKIQRDLR